MMTDTFTTEKLIEIDIDSLKILFKVLIKMIYVKSNLIPTKNIKMQCVLMMCIILTKTVCLTSIFVR